LGFVGSYESGGKIEQMHEGNDKSSLSVPKWDSIGVTNMTATTFAKLITDGGSPLTLQALCKAQIAGGNTGLEKHDYIAAIQKRGDLLFPTIASPQARFAKAMTDDDTGRLLYAAAKAAPGSEVDKASVARAESDADRIEDTVETEAEVKARIARESIAAAQRPGGKAPPFPNAEKALEPLIEKYQREHPEKSYQQAYVAALESNPALAKRVLDASRGRALAG
jgi:hypothetical protein